MAVIGRPVAVQRPEFHAPIVSVSGHPNRPFVDFLERLWRRSGGTEDAVGSSAPSGQVISFAGSTLPTGWLPCDGSAVSRTDYAELFAAIGTTWGPGDGSLTFNVPDLQGRTVVGTGIGTGLTARTLADTGGEEAHALVLAENGPHGHTITDTGHVHAVTDPGHDHPGVTADSFVMDGAGTEYVNTAGDKGVVATDTATNTTGLTVDSATTSIVVDSSGSGTPHENMQPFAALSWLIKH